MFRLIIDPVIEVRLTSLLAFNTAIKHRENLVRRNLDVFLPWLYSETKVKPELVKEVQMGPFKHTIDYGLDCRKVGGRFGRNNR